jgi:hypothetical protein
MTRKKKNIQFPVAAILLLALVAVLVPLINKGFFVSDDGEWMIIRLTAFYQAFREGQFPVRFLGRLNNSYGYPVANFLYPGFLYIGSLFRAMGFSFVDSVKLILGGSVVGASVFLFLWLRIFFTPFLSASGVLSFLFAPYLLFDIYKRGSVGEVLALCWAAMGIYSIDAKKPWLFVPAVALLIVAHNSLALLFIGFFLFYVISTGRLRDYLYPFVLGVGLSTFFWFPALHERVYTVFNSVSISNPVEYVLRGHMVLLGGLVFILSGVFLLWKWKFSSRTLYMLIVLFGSLLLAMPISASIWNIPFLAKYFQFPFRFLSLGLIAGPWVVASAMEKCPKAGRIVFILIMSPIWVYTIANTYSNIRFRQEPEGYYTTNESTTTVHDEYMPRWVVRTPNVRASGRIEFYKGKGLLEPKKITTQTMDVTVLAYEDSVLQINTVYYPGWGASLDDRQIGLDYENQQGVMRVSVPKGTHRLIVAFRETVSRFIADIISLGAFVLFLIYLKYSLKQKYLR